MAMLGRDGSQSAAVEDRVAPLLLEVHVVLKERGGRTVRLGRDAYVEREKLLAEGELMVGELLLSAQRILATGGESA